MCAASGGYHRRVPEDQPAAAEQRPSAPDVARSAALGEQGAATVDQDGAAVGGERRLVPPDEPVVVAGLVHVRRAPRVGRFIGTGAVLGALVGLVLALVAGRDSAVVADGTAFISVLDGQGAARAVMAVAGGCLGALLGGAAAVLADRRR